MKPLDLLQFTRGRLEAQHTAKAIYAERLAPEFSIFDFLDTRENGLSRVFAWLLDPTGSHAQGPRFLEAFMRWLGLDEEWIALAPGARAWLEIPTTVDAYQGYIDIVVQMRGRALGIENKPFAIDQPRQVERYLDHLKHHSPGGHCLLYLSGGGDGPTSESIDPARAVREIADGHLIVRGYPAIVGFLETCLGVCRAPSLSMAIDGLIQHIQKVFMGMSEGSEAGELARTICDSPQMIGAALALLEAGTPIREKILKRFDDAVRVRIADRGWHVIRNTIGSSAQSKYVIGFEPDATVGIGFQFFARDYTDLFCGVAELEGRDIPEDSKPSLRALIGNQSGDRWWPVWKYVGPNDRHFPFAKTADRGFWLAAYDGRLADMLVEFVAEVESVLQASGHMEAMRTP